MTTCDEILAERLLIRRCQQGDQAAWFELFQCYQGCVWRSARRFLGSEGRNEDLVEEITAEVWASLGVHNGKRLLGYVPDRSQFATFLASRTWQVVQNDRKKRRWRRLHEVQPGPCDPEPPAFGLSLALLERYLEEFLATLPEWEAAFCRENVLRVRGPQVLATMSAGCFNKRVERLRRKFKRFLDDRGPLAPGGAG